MPKRVRNDRRTTPLAKASTPPQEWNCSPLWRHWLLSTCIELLSVKKQ
ncbi:MAG: hypothetical protein FWG85_05105 [Bacteroidetes bacterium]|nr:hypothetical protein [Bacteroidota bacterium]